jgi:hypothetical protein
MKRYFEAPPKGLFRRRLAPLLLVLGLLAALKLTYDVAPREQSVQVLLPDALRADLQGVRLTYLEDGEAVSGSEQRFPQDAPLVLRSRPTLSPGTYQLDIELSRRGGAVTRVRRAVTVPTEGSLRIHLGEEP